VANRVLNDSSEVSRPDRLGDAEVHSGQRSGSPGVVPATIAMVGACRLPLAAFRGEGFASIRSLELRPGPLPVGAVAFGTGPPAPSGSANQKVLPRPTVLCTAISPPGSVTSSFATETPSPVHQSVGCQLALLAEESGPFEGAPRQLEVEPGVAGSASLTFSPEGVTKLADARFGAAY
jgi:hypothetical protein